jgi:hypothetical protein
MMPGIQPIMVNKVTTKIAPQPLSNTARGGNMIAKISLPHPIILILLSTNYPFSKSGNLNDLPF